MNNIQKTNEIKSLVKIKLDNAIRNRFIPGIKYLVSVNTPSRSSLEKRIEIDIIQLPFNIKKYYNSLQTKEYYNLIKNIKDIIQPCIPPIVSSVLVK